MFQRYLSKKSFKLTLLALAAVLLVLCSSSLLAFLLNSHCLTAICLNQAHSQILTSLSSAAPVSLGLVILLLGGLILSLLSLIRFLEPQWFSPPNQYGQKVRKFLGSTKLFNYLSLFLRQGLLSPKNF